MQAGPPALAIQTRPGRARQLDGADRHLTGQGHSTFCLALSLALVPSCPGPLVLTGPRAPLEGQTEQRTEERGAGVGLDIPVSSLRLSSLIHEIQGSESVWSSQLTLLL